ncbi:hypothetical protein AX14_009255 [Amanita brunnescens Koide BX004]|nr:hypothetical protein AX14_009255 [Amanita brunnescens Koide BX004]
MPRPSFSASNFGGEARVSVSEDSVNRATEKTDNLVQQIIQDAILNSVLAGELSSMKVPFKLLPPVFKGTDSIEEFLSFTKGLVNYLAIHGYMKPEMDSIRVHLLGHILTDKALRWFQQAINYGVDDQWSFEDTIFSLKRHFVKDASTQDAARKFEQLEQRSQSVPELRRELEQLSMQMVEAIASCSLTTTFLLWTLPILCLLVVVVGLRGALGSPQVLFSKLSLLYTALFSTVTGWNTLGSFRTLP